MIGQPGSSPCIRLTPGGVAAANQMFQELAQNGIDVTPPGHTGTLIELKGQGHVGYRAVSSKNGPPTIDVNLPGVARIQKVEFP
jgi:hypothetical protein